MDIPLEMFPGPGVAVLATAVEGWQVESPPTENGEAEAEELNTSDSCERDNQDGLKQQTEDTSNSNPHSSQKTLIPKFKK